MRSESGTDAELMGTTNRRRHIVPINVPSLIIGLDIFMEHGMSTKFKKHILTCKKEKWNIPLHYVREHVYITPETRIRACNCTYKELTKLHYRFMHLSSKKLYSFLKNAYPKSSNQGTRQILEKYKKHARSVTNI